MALTKETDISRIEVVGTYKHVQVRTDTVVKEDGVELSRSFSRHVVAPNISSDDLANESADVRAMAAHFHTDAVKTAYATHIANTQNVEISE